MSNKRFRSESIQDTTSISAYLEALKNGFEQGNLVLKQGGKSISFAPSGLVTFNVEAKTRGSERKIKISLKWHEGEIPEDADDTPLIINS